MDANKLDDLSNSKQLISWNMRVDTKSPNSQTTAHRTEWYDDKEIFIINYEICPIWILPILRDIKKKWRELGKNPYDVTD